MSIIKQITLILSASLKLKDEKAFPWHATEINYILYLNAQTIYTFPSKGSNFSNKLPLQYLILPWLVLTSCLRKVRRAGLGAGDIGKTAASFSMHVRAGGRSLSQMPVYRSQRGLKITSSSTRTSVTPDSGRGRDGGPNDPCQDQAFRQPLSLQGKHALVWVHKCKQTHTHRVTHTRTRAVTTTL